MAIQNSPKNASVAHRFRTEVLRAGKTATGIVVTATVVEQLGAGKRPTVSVTINGHTFGYTVAVMGGKYMIGISAELRATCGVEGGDTVEVELRLDTSPRVVEVPAELVMMLKKEPAAKAHFDRLSYSKRKAHALAITSAKTDATKGKAIGRGDG